MQYRFLEKNHDEGFTFVTKIDMIYSDRLSPPALKGACNMVCHLGVSMDGIMEGYGINRAYITYALWICQKKCIQYTRGKQMREMELKALAKINLGLDVLGRRENGYHDVRMIMQSIYLYDNVFLKKKEEPGIDLKTNLYFLPVNENNIAYQAAELLMKEFDIPGGISITLKKHIPVAAGMAGGSTNAAAVLFGMNKMYDLSLSMEELMERGLKLGADVPYCIMRGTVLAEGIGEKLTELPALMKCVVLIAKPPISVSTKDVYEALDSKDSWNHPDIDGIMVGLRVGSLRKVAACMGNVLEQVTVQNYPVIDDIKRVMIEEGALNAMMSGSGPTVFGIFEERYVAKKAQKRIYDLGLARQVYVTNVHGVRRK